MNRDEEEVGHGTTPGWWLHRGPAICTHCGHGHQMEAMLYCSVCDAMVCAVCVVDFLAETEPICPVCHTAAPGGE